MLVGNSPGRPLLRRRHRDTVRGAGRAAPEPDTVRIVPRRVRQRPVPAEGRAQAELPEQRRAQDARVRRREPGERAGKTERGFIFARSRCLYLPRSSVVGAPSRVISRLDLTLQVYLFGNENTVDARAKKIKPFASCYTRKYTCF